RKARLPFLKPDLAPNPIVAGHSYDCEGSELSVPEWRRLLQITDGTGAVEELPLELRRNSIPAHKHGRAQALQNLGFFLSEGSTVVAILSFMPRGGPPWGAGSLPR